MNHFSLDPRLEKDCIVTGKLDLSNLLLMNNSLVPWFILVPETSELEVIDLPQEEQATLLNEINLVSAFVKGHFNITKLNIAAIGNIVNQLHIHVVGRDPSDYCWPDVVWGTNKKVEYSDERLSEIKIALLKHLGDQFSANR